MRALLYVLAAIGGGTVVLLTIDLVDGWRQETRNQAARRHWDTLQ